MATWNEVSLDCLRAAGELMQSGRYRSSVSRAYYAAYSAVTAALSHAGVAFKDDHDGPSHPNARALIGNHFPKLSRKKRKLLMAAMHRLYESRLDADYRPVCFVGLETARDALANASVVAGTFGVT